MDNSTLNLFETLTQLHGAPGHEHEVRDFMKQQLSKYADEIILDNLGGVFGIKYGNGPKVMVAGHMDEVGFLVTQITKQGLIRFQPLGGWWNQVLLSQRVQIKTEKGPIIGVISSIPPHNLTASQRKKPMEVKHMLIDIGADNREDALNIGVKPGDAIVPTCPFTPMANNKKIMAKAWDNRFGCGLAIELMKEVQHDQLPNQLYSGATVQEEVGLRGAKVAAHLIQPDIFYALDASPANDMDGDDKAFGKLGEGVLLRIFDRTMITHKGLKEFILDTAESNKIPYQFFVSQGGTDAGRIHISNDGIPSAVIGICSRYIHTSSSIIHVEDYAAAKELLVQLVKTTDANTLEQIRQN